MKEVKAEAALVKGDGIGSPRHSLGHVLPQRLASSS